ncbi:MAG: SDR family oxidoreductase [Alphaproteobacteria bacterium]|nr:SDR family oxidoreductase [Alphaproteobacteria bacterium]MCW5740218.1 SDR family oxidoreductase [Alphaproteobacteria bacterium]
MNALSEKVAIITGASAGIGEATARLFAREGASLVLAARGREALDRVAGQIIAAGGRAVALAGDIGEEGFAAELVATARRAFGGLDIAFNNAAALGTLKPAPELTTAQWRDVIATNLDGAFFAARQQIPAMLARGGGSLIFTSSFVGYTAGMPGMAAYAASKAGVIGLTKVLAVEVAAQGVRVNALLPGGVDTAMAAEFASTEETKAFVRGLHALKRVARPDEIAQSALYLASDASSFTTGSAMLVDGGVSINRV